MKYYFLIVLIVLHHQLTHRHGQLIRITNITDYFQIVGEDLIADTEYFKKTRADRIADMDTLLFAMELPVVIDICLNLNCF